MQFLSLDIIYSDKYSIFLFLYTETLKPRFHCICKQNLHRDSNLWNMVEVNVPYKHYVTLHGFTMTQSSTQLLLSGARISNFITYFICGDKMST